MRVMVGGWTTKTLSMIGVTVWLALLSFAQNQNGMNGGTSSVRTGVAAGSTLGANGTHDASVYQTKAVLDVRDIKGVDCTGAMDSSAALNALTGNPPSSNNAITGRTLSFGDCLNISLANTCSIYNQASFILDGLTRSGAAQKGINVSWSGLGSGPMIDMEYVDGFQVQGFNLQGNANATVGLNVDKNGSGGTWNTTDGRLVNNSYQGSNQNWIGVSLSAVSTQNVEDMRIEDSTFSCGAPVATTAAIGIRVGSSPNAKNEIFKHNNFTNCLYGVLQGGGSIQVRDSEFEFSGGTCGSGTGRDLKLSGNSDPDIIRGNLDENGNQFITTNDSNGLSSPVIVTGNHWAYSPGCHNPSHYLINPGIGANTWLIEGNSWDADSSLVKIIGTARTGQAQIYTRGN